MQQKTDNINSYEPRHTSIKSLNYTERLSENFKSNFQSQPTNHKQKQESATDSSLRFIDKDHLFLRLIEQIDNLLTKSNDNGEQQIKSEDLTSMRDLFIIYLLHNKDLYIEYYSSKTNKNDQLFLHRFHKILEKYYQDNSLNLISISNKLAMSHRQVQRRLKNITGCSPNEYLRSFRIKKAASLLSKGYRVEDVAYDVGFTTRNYFGRCFKAIMGVNPKKYQQML